MRFHVLCPLTLLAIAAGLIGGCLPAGPVAPQSSRNPENDLAARQRFQGKRSPAKRTKIAQGTAGDRGMGANPGMGRGFGPGMGMGLRRLADDLNLSPDQRTQFESIRADSRARMDAIQMDTSLSPKNQRDKMMATIQSTRTKISAILTVSQMRQWVQIRKEREIWRQNNSPQDDPNGPA